MSVTPTHYDIKLKPERVSSIICNANELLLSASVVTDSTTISPVTSLHKEEETVTLALGQQLSPGLATVTYQFTGILNDKMSGFYRSMYMKDGQEQFAAVTQFEATDARQAFPCWDEPAVKATFAMTIVGPKDRVILSNMPEIESKDDPEDITCKVHLPSGHCGRGVSFY